MGGSYIKTALSGSLPFKPPALPGVHDLPWTGGAWPGAAGPVAGVLSAGKADLVWLKEGVCQKAGASGAASASL